MTPSPLRHVLVGSIVVLAACAPQTTAPTSHQDRPRGDAPRAAEERAMEIHYLEIVTPDVKATCNALEKVHGVTFGDPVAELGGARTADLGTGGLIGVRPPLRDDEEPVVRPYVLVDDIDAAVEAAAAAGGVIAMMPTEIPGRGRFAIYSLGGIQYGLWEL